MLRNMHLARRFLIPMLAAASWPGHAQDTNLSAHLCTADQDRCCIQGSVGDESGAPLKGVEVEVLPVEKVGEDRWNDKESAWTDSYGVFLSGTSDLAII